MATISKREAQPSQLCRAAYAQYPHIRNSGQRCRAKAPALVGSRGKMVHSSQCRVQSGHLRDRLRYCFRITGPNRTQIDRIPGPLEKPSAA